MIRRNDTMNKRWLIGLTSGSSLLGVDAAVAEATGIGMELQPRLVHSLRLPFPRDLRDLVARLGANQQTGIRQASLLHRLLGETFAQAARMVVDEAKLSMTQVQCIGCPGHTIWHEPEGRFPSTLSLGMTSVIAERTGVTTFSDFRSRDVVVGGQGIPMTSMMDYLLFHQPGEERVLLHLGGMATVLFLPGDKGMRRVLGFQAAPCNLLLDNLMQRLTGGRETYDAGGKHAVQGCCIEPLLERWLSHPALQRRPPKILPRQEFGEEFIAQALELARKHQGSLHDLLCTATHFVSRSILQALERFVPGRVERVLLSGGGVRNGLLWRLLEHGLEHVPLERVDQHGIPIDARKAVAFAGLAALALDGVSANLPSVTGASGSRLLGTITPGSPANWARCLAWMAAQASPLNLAA
jgi:anhydro-N-acetylmuramic acid kinase